MNPTTLLGPEETTRHDRTIRESRLLVVDDHEQNVTLLRSLLSVSGFENVVGTTDSSQAVPLCAGEQPDLLLLDLQMPHPDGFEVLRQLEPWTKGVTRLPILVLTADHRRETRMTALSSGASDFLSKPFDTTEVVLRVTNLLSTRVLALQLRDQNLLLEERVRERTRALEDARREVVERLALASEYRDDASAEHTRRVGHLAALLATELGLGDETTELIRLAAALHDVGKIAVSDAILAKRDELTADELEALKVHTTVGAEILGRGTSDLLRMSGEIAFTHHEWWDGSGYPSGLHGEQIPFAGRIVAVADAFDTLTHRQPGRSALPSDRAVSHIAKLRGRQFDPSVVDALRAVLSAPGGQAV